MINIFNELYTYLVNTLASYDGTIKTSSVYTNTPSSYPFVSFEEIEDSVYEQGSDCCEIENFANKDYEINIYTQNPNKKSEADGIAQVVDALMKSKGFTRISRTPLQDTNETTYRIVLRYSGVVSKDHIIYRR
jgi:hypothetical protein